MKLLIQRVAEASVVVGEQEIAKIKKGILVFVGFEKNDTPALLDKAAEKLKKIRIFSDSDQKMNLTLQDIEGSILLVPNFTLAGSLQKGNRPGFDNSLEPKKAAAYFEDLIKSLQEKGLPIQTGKFGADMKVSLINDGPVTFTYDLTNG